MCIRDSPYTIYYLTGRFIQPGERFLALYISTEGNHRFFINDLFTVNEDFGVEKVDVYKRQLPSSATFIHFRIVKLSSNSF